MIRLSALAVLGLALLPAGAAVAALGGDAASVGADARHFHASMRQAQSAGSWTVQELQGDGGTVIHEFIDSSGRVFAVAWAGPANPDLRQLLGSDNFLDFQNHAATAPRHGHGLARVTTPGMVYEARGRLPHFQGRAWLPALLPAGFDTDAIN